MKGWVNIFGFQVVIYIWAGVYFFGRLGFGSGFSRLKNNFFNFFYF
jgi:hypothetical protein